jgi:hypothetical protein
MSQIEKSFATQSSSDWVGNLQALGADDRGGPTWTEIQDIHMILDRFLKDGAALSRTSTEAGRLWTSVQREGKSLRVTFDDGEQRSLVPAFLTLEHYPNLPTDSFLFIGFEVAPETHEGTLSLSHQVKPVTASQAGKSGAVPLGQKGKGAKTTGLQTVMLCCVESTWVELELHEVKSGADYVLRRMAREATPVAAKAVAA